MGRLYFLLPETTRRSLEEIDLISAEVHNNKDCELCGHVQRSLTRPRIHGRELDVELRALVVSQLGATRPADFLTRVRPLDDGRQPL
ncbi:hypothetical protein JCM10207_009037 [Rhodosporidiobolus poonsookiae]